MPAPRFRVDPRDVPAKAAGIILGLTEADFRAKLPLLVARGFPKPDETTGNFDLNAIDRWCDRRHPGLFIVATEHAVDARQVVAQRLEAMKRHGSG